MVQLIRRATQDDYQHIYKLTLRFNDKYFGKPVNGEKLERWFDMIVKNGIIYFTSAGYIAGFPMEDPVRDHTVLIENAWYSEDRRGAALLREFITYGKSIGVDEVRMTTLNTTPPGVLLLLKRMGFEEVETSHRLEL